jgi:hypothetical protein
MTQEGTTLQGWFAYGPSSPIAQGTRLPVTILDAHDADSLLTGVQLEDVASADQAIVGIVDSSANQITLSGESAGGASVRFSGVASGERRNDEFEAFVEQPTAMTLFVECAEPLVLRGERAFVSFDFEPFSRGEGFYPVLIDPPAAATVNAEASNYRHIILDVAADAPDSFTVSVDPASGLTGNTVTFQVVDDRPQQVIAQTPFWVDTLQMEPLDQVVPLPVGSDMNSMCVVYPVSVSTSGTCGLIHQGAFTRSADVLSTDIALVALAVGRCVIEVVMDVAGDLLSDSVSVETTAPFDSTGGGGGGGGGFDFD